MNKRLKKYVWGSLAGFINGFFASGGGIVAVLVLEKIFSFEEKKAHATAIAVILPLTVASIFVYGSGGFIDLPLVLKCSLGGIAGAFIGAKLLNRLPKKYLRMGFGVVMIIAAVRMFLRGAK